MPIRLADTDDIAAMHSIRMAVHENTLSDPGRITEQDYRRMIEEVGRGWVYENSDTIVGFGIVDLSERNVWALFVAPNAEGNGVGSTLLNAMVDHAVTAGIESLWLTTTRNTRAEGFYRRAGWKAAGITEGGELRFELQLPSNR